MKLLAVTLLLSVAALAVFMLLSSGVFNRPNIPLPENTPPAETPPVAPPPTALPPTSTASSGSWQPVFHGPTTAPHIKGPSGPPPRY